MERRESLKLMSGFAPMIFLPTSTNIISKNLDSSELLQMFSIRMKSIETHCYEIFKSLPIADFNFQPTPEIMPFGKIFSHIGLGLEIYSGVLDGSTPVKEPDSINRSGVLTYLENGFSHFNNVLMEQEDKDLFSYNHHYPDEEPWKELRISEIVLLAYSHVTHHKAQATVYLRLKNSTPPKWRF